MQIELYRDYRGTPTHDALLVKGMQEVDDKLGEYLVAKKYARAISAVEALALNLTAVVKPAEPEPVIEETPVWVEPEPEPEPKAKTKK